MSFKLTHAFQKIKSSNHQKIFFYEPHIYFPSPRTFSNSIICLISRHVILTFIKLYNLEHTPVFFIISFQITNNSKELFWSLGK